MPSSDDEYLQYRSRDATKGICSLHSKTHSIAFDSGVVPGWEVIRITPPASVDLMKYGLILRLDTDMVSLLLLTKSKDALVSREAQVENNNEIHLLVPQTSCDENFIVLYIAQ